MIRNTASKLFLVTALAAAVLTTALVLARPGTAQVPPGAQQAPADRPQQQRPDARPGQAPPRQPQRPEAVLKIGTYDPQTAFNAHPAQAELNEMLGEARAEMEKAYQDEDQEKIQQIQQRYEQAHQKAVQRFERDVSSTLPKVAKAADIKVVAVQVVYQADDVRTVDLTPRLAHAFAEEDNGREEETSARPAIPPLPRE